MKIGITAQIQFSLFSGGAGGTSLALAEVFRNTGHDVWLINTNPSVEWWDDCPSLKQLWASTTCKLSDLGQGILPGNGQPFDLVIEVDKPSFPSGADRKRVSKKNVWVLRKSPILHDIEASLFPFDNGIRNIEGFDYVWAFDQTCCEDDLKYLELLTRSKATLSPFVWSPSPVEVHRAETKAPEWSQVTENLGKENPWRVHICETNNSAASSMTLPLVIMKDVKQRGGFPVKEWVSHNSEHVSKSQFFLQNVKKHCEIADLSGSFMGRQRIIDWVYDAKSCILSHSRFIPLRPFHLDAAWVGIPMVHNSPFLQGLTGSGYERLYYPDNQVVAATQALQQLQKDYEAKDGIFNAAARNTTRQAILAGISPFSSSVCTRYNELMNIVLNIPSVPLVVAAPVVAEAPVEVAAPVVLVAPVEVKQKVLKVVFTDMWDDFNPTYNMFTVMMNEAGRHLENPVKAEGYTLEMLKGEKPDLVIFGPFGQQWYTVEESVPKVHFTGENSKIISHDSVKLNIGFQHADFMDQQYLRLPLWMLEIDWFGVDKEKIANPKPLPIDRCTKIYTEDIPRKTKFCSFVVTNPCNPVRNNSFMWLSQYKHVDSAGRLFNNVGDAIFAGLGGGGGELKKFEFLQNYKFCLAYENSSSQGYTTEKYLHAKAAGCIPIYWGDPKFERDFDIDGCIDARRFSTPEELIEAVRKIDETPSLWLKKFSVPALDEPRRDLTRRVLSECSRRLLKLALNSEDGLDKIPRFLGATSDKEAKELATAREGPTMNGSVEGDKLVVKTNTSHLVTQSQKREPIPSIVVCTGATMRFLPSLHQWLVGMNAQKQNPGLAIEADIWLGQDVNEDVVQELTKEFGWMRFHRFPEMKVDAFDDFWNPQHFAWKLWILNEMATRKDLSGKMVLYLDSGAFMCRWPIDWMYIAKERGICFLEDPRETNDRWCSDIFCKKLAVSQEEKNQQQLWAGAIAFEAGNTLPVELFKEALKWGKDREVIAGPKWEGVRNGKPFGHRHDQSILSILSNRFSCARYPLDLLYCGESLRRTFMTKKCFYVHRGGFQVHKPFLPEVDDCYVINLDRRADRMEKLYTNSPELKGVVQRVSAVEGKNLQMTPAIARLFRPHDFGWKKPVLGCALSHLGIWWQLANERDDINSYLILEDDVKFQPEWQKTWAEAAPHIPENYDVIYLGGILPPNRSGFELVKEKTNPYFSRVAENNFFGQQPKNRYFHWCAYSYVLSKQGARKIIEILNAKDGYWTSADHMVCNMVNVMNIYFLDPLVAGCYQDDDPRYQNSEFNDFSRVDGFDSDLWNNNECFEKGEAEILAHMNIPIDIPLALADAASLKKHSSEERVGSDTEGQAKESLVNEINTKVCKEWEQMTAVNKTNTLEARQIAFQLLENWNPNWNENTIEEFTLLADLIHEKILAGLPSREKLTFYKGKMIEVFEVVSDSNKGVVQKIVKYLDELIIMMEITTPHPVLKGKRLVGLREQNLVSTNLYEGTWLKELLGKDQSMHIYPVDETETPPTDEPILIVMRPWWPQIIRLLRYWQEANVKFYILHLSDETGMDPIFFYGWDQCLGVVRNYWRDDIDIFGEKVLVVPLGYHWTKNDGIPDVEKDTPRLPFREKIWSFAGTNWNGRQEKMANLTLLQPHDVRWFKEWNDSQMLEKDVYLNTLLNSRFIPCPGGVNAETYRFYEALECGCIPLYVRQENDTLYFEKHIKANIPMVELPSWDHAAALMYQLTNDPPVMEGYRYAILQGYKTWKLLLKEKVKILYKLDG
jgi:GR25 family glycosyltransferase involved in LPS biosynthesis